MTVQGNNTTNYVKAQLNLFVVEFVVSCSEKLTTSNVDRGVLCTSCNSANLHNYLAIHQEVFVLEEGHVVPHLPELKACLEDPGE